MVFGDLSYELGYVAGTKKETSKRISCKVLLLRARVGVRDRTFLSPLSYYPRLNAKSQYLFRQKSQVFFSISLEAAFYLGFWL